MRDSIEPMGRDPALEPAAMGPMEPMGPMGGGGEHAVPLEALSMPDETEQMTAPEVGDRVSYTVEGVVSRIEGGQAMVAPEAVNGVAVGGAAETPAPALDEFAGLEEEAMGRGML
jgi:hypothetical protein